MNAVQPHYKVVRELLQGRKFAIDDYQREYKWESKHIQELLEDLKSKFSQNYQPSHTEGDIETYDPYFLGSIIISLRDNKNYLIDGQQRTTSLTLLLIALYHQLKNRDDEAAKEIADLIFSSKLGSRSFNLDIPYRRDVFEALYKDQPFNPDGKDESVQTIYARYQDIQNEFGVSQNSLGTEENSKFLDEDELSTLHSVRFFAYWLMYRVGVIEISTTDDAQAYAIFETMNDRGKPLSPTDMLKAFVLARITNAEQRKLANRKWRELIHKLLSAGQEREGDRDATFIKAWLRAQHARDTRLRKAGAVNRDWEVIGTAFHRWVRDNSVQLKLNASSDFEAFISKDFPYYAHVYETIQTSSQTFTNGLEAIFYNAVNDFTLQDTVLLAPIRLEDDAHTIRRKLQVTATYLDIFIVRRVANYIRVNYSNVSYAMFTVIKDIRGKSLDELVHVLTQKLDEDDVTFDSAKDGKRLGIENLYLNNFTKRYIHYMLARLSSHLEQLSDQPQQFSTYVQKKSRNPFEVEHIYPHTFDWRGVFENAGAFYLRRDHISALVLLPRDANASLQNKPYSRKLDTYARQNALTASLATRYYEGNPRFRRLQESLPLKPYTQFTPHEQAERFKLYSELIHKIWHADRLQEEAERSIT